MNKTMRMLEAGAVALIVLAVGASWSVHFASAAVPQSTSRLTVIHSFSGGTDGANPNGNLVSDAAGILYGVTFEGGSQNCTGGCGTVFELTISGGTWQKTTIFEFTGPSGNGGNPLGSLIFDGSGNLYGVTTFAGGGLWTIYKLTPSQGMWKETILYSVVSEDSPVAGLAFDGQGNLYGTTSGAVFELSLLDGKWNYTTVHTFGGIDGLFTQSGVTIDKRGNLYGTTYQGGYNDLGEVFMLVPTKRGWIETMNAAVGELTSSVIVTSQQDVYGVAERSGQNNDGFAYELSLSNGFWAVNVLYNFGGYPIDGQFPIGGLVREPNTGKFYGTTAGGGFHGLGTVYQLVRSNGIWSEKVLASFNGSNGENTYSGVIFGQGGNLYGTTPVGGASNYGEVYEVTP
jgi:uncharacterized repeat protein (TIGR03803 family)